MSWNVNPTDTSVYVTLGFGWNASTSSEGNWLGVTVPFSVASIWNDINDFTKVYGTTATISNIRSNVTGAHYTSNNVTGNGAGSFTWTFNTEHWACEMYSAWNTYTVVYNGNGATGGSTANSSHTYNTAKALTANGYTRTEYKFAGWSTSKTATSATYSDKQSVSNLTATNGGTVTLYAVWTPIAPYSLSLSGTGNSTSSINLKLVASSAVAISNYTVYYKTGSATTYNSKSFGSSATGSITGLISDANYTIYFTATYSTKLSNPTITTPVVSNLLPFTCTISATGSITPSRALTYSFSKDGGNTWTAYQSSNLYDWTGLTEETSYDMRVRVKATHIGTNAIDTTNSSSLSITTPADQAKIRIKDNGVWKKGKTYYKKDGRWVKAKKIYIKVNGQWKINNNYDN